MKKIKCPKCGILKTGKYIKDGLCKSCAQKIVEKKTGWHHSDETKDKIRQKTLKQFKNGMPKKTKDKLKEKRKKQRFTKETREKMRWASFYRQGGEFRKKTKSGYILIFKPEHPNVNSGSRIFEHRLVMEKKVGRYLEKDEMVHHINKIKDDNRPENLCIVKSHKEHKELEIREFDCPHCKKIININI